MLGVLIVIGPIALVAALAALVIYYVGYRNVPERMEPRSLARYASIALTVGAFAYLAGALLGIAVACAPADAGNLCGLAGVLGVGPLLSAAAMFVYAHFWARRS